MQQMIDIQFQSVIELVDGMFQTAEKLENIETLYFSEILKETEKGWEGDAANEFMRKEKMIIDELSKQSKDLKKIAWFIEQQALIMYGAEVTGVALARARNYFL